MSYIPSSICYDRYLLYIKHPVLKKMFIGFPGPK